MFISKICERIATLFWKISSMFNGLALFFLEREMKKIGGTWIPTDKEENEN